MTTTTAPATPSAAAPLPSDRITPARLEALAARVRTEGERERMGVEQPFTGGPLGAVPRCTPDDVRAAIARARAAQAAWARTSFAERRRMLLRFHDLVLVAPGRDPRPAPARVRQGAPARVRGGPRRRDRRPLLRATRAERHLKTAPPARRAAAPHGRLRAPPPGRRRRRDRAVELPADAERLATRRPALAAGNAVVVKPDSQTPFAALWGFALLEEAGLPPDLVQVVTGSGSELGPHLIEGSDYVMFTGQHGDGPARSPSRRAAADRRLDGAGRQERDDRARTTPTSAARSRAPSARCSPTPASCASRSSGCSCTRRSPTSSRAGWSSASAG